MVFIRTFSPEDSRAEDQGLTWTCPPRAVFKLFGLGTSEGELDPTTASSFSSSGGSPRAPEHVLVRRGADPSRSDASIPPKNNRPRSAKEPNQIRANRPTNQNQEGLKNNGNNAESIKNQAESVQRVQRVFKECPISVSPFPFYPPGVARFRHDSSAVGEGCRNPFLGIPHASRFMSILGHEIWLVQHWVGGSTFPPLSAQRMPGAEGFCLLFYLEP